MSPVLYQVQVNSTSPLFIVLDTNYDRFWCATTEDGSELRPIIANSYGEAFYLNKTGSHIITIYYKNQQTFEEAWMITIITYVASAAVLVGVYAGIKIENKHKKTVPPLKSTS